MHLLVLQLLDKGLPGFPISKVLWKGNAVCRRGQAAPWGLSGLDRRGQVARGIQGHVQAAVRGPLGQGAKQPRR